MAPLCCCALLTTKAACITPLPRTIPTPSLRSGKLSAAQRELAEAEQRLGDKAERLRASLKQEMSAAQQQVGGLAGVWSNSPATVAWAAWCSLLTGRLRYGSPAGDVKLRVTAVVESVWW